MGNIIGFPNPEKLLYWYTIKNRTLEYISTTILQYDGGIWYNREIDKFRRVLEARKLFCVFPIAIS